MVNIKIKYHVDGLQPVFQAHDQEWCDLRCAEDIVLKKGQSAYVNLGVSIELPEGYEAIMAPRSSTFKKYKVIQTNHIGVIDAKFCGNADIWMMPVYAMEDTVIKKNERICQFRIQPVQPGIKFEVVTEMTGENRGGLGSTGTE